MVENVVETVGTQPEDDPWVVERTGERDLRFQGLLLGEGSDRVSTGRSSSRWSETRIFSIDGAPGRYVVALARLTCWQGELDHHQAIVCESPQGVIDALVVDGVLGLSEKEALQAASKCDRVLRGVLFVAP